MEAFRKTRAIVNLDQLIGNTKNLKKLLPAGVFFCPMVKANAYGHGVFPVVEALAQHGFERVGVSLLEEGIELRDQGYRGEILVFGSISRGFNEMMNYHLIPVVSDFSHLELLNKTVSSAMKVHLKFDTGMSRMGFASNEAAMVKEFFVKNKKFTLQGLLSHLHSGDDFDLTKTQVDRLNEVVPYFQDLNPQVHLWNTSGLLNTPVQEMALPWGARPGIGLYTLGAAQTVMSFRSLLVQTHRIPKGRSVSYGATWTADRDSLIGTVTCGYADGYHRRLSGVGEVLILGERVPVRGIVCMDYFMVDLTELEKKYPGKELRGQEVTLFGQDEKGNALPIEEVAAKAGTNTYEILTSVSARVPRTYEVQK